MAVYFAGFLNPCPHTGLPFPAFKQGRVLMSCFVNIHGSPALLKSKWRRSVWGGNRWEGTGKEEGGETVDGT